ncbi:trans-aconitate 2-methyltransferase [Georgenia soli]|uniref:Trans-aconitate 2-methyltransferase n=1 Tax=Georgenia soli TaxID=638953 RepID=A0A2A9EJG4_9MICO|nr:methyltransferase domain-containing protein [Georgenia soli]PFG38385.1 trans-aconitate 2-methyltransferase [Georgenia soli]
MTRQAGTRTTWDADVYERFAAHRARPVADLLARVGAVEPELVVDLGCGTGASTRPLAARWPRARIVGVDSSPHMLERARRTDTERRIEWVEADIIDWRLPGRPDVVVTNAVLQWVPGHLDLLAGWVSSLAAGGWFALQVPGNAEAPNHTLLRDLVAVLPEGPELTSLLLGKGGAADPAGYAAALHAAGCEVDAWETTYLHLLDPAGELDNPVLEWMRGTGLRPLLGRLEPAREAQLLHRYASALADAYPRSAMGVPMPFRRVFAVGRRRT